MPKISVIMSIYKEPEDWIKKSIDSVLCQTYSDFEFIIICDNPLYDKAKAILKLYAESDKRVLLIFNDDNIGLTKSLNKGLDYAKGEYIARMDADDICLPNRFQCQLNFMSLHPQVDVCGSYIYFFGSIPFYSQRRKKFPISHQDIKVAMLFENPFAHSSIMMKKIIGGKIIRYDENFPKAQDYKLWCDLLSRGAIFANLNKVLIKYRISASQISNIANNSQQVTSKVVRSYLVCKLFGNNSNEISELHDKVVSLVVDEIKLDEKLNWISKVYNMVIKFNNEDKYIKSLFFKYWYQNCLLYSNPYKIFQFPFFSFNLLLTRVFYLDLFKCIIP